MLAKKINEHKGAVIGMKWGVLVLQITVLSFIYGNGLSRMAFADSFNPASKAIKMTINLPKPKYSGDVSVEESLFTRRSVRDYTGESLTLNEISQLLWAAQGTTSNRGFRTTPSAGALYPLEVYLIVGEVKDLSIGMYRYNPKKHELFMIADQDVRQTLASAALKQNSVKNGAINLVFTAVYQKTTQKYGKRGIKYVHMEIGHAAQNVCLQATAMKLGVVTIGAFNDQKVSRILKLPKNEVPLYIIPVGKID